MAAPTSAVAGPDDTKTDGWTETFEWSMSSGRARLGVMAIGLTPELRKHFGAPEGKGVLIGRVEPGSAAATAGLAVGDVLIEVKGTAVDSAADVLAALESSKKHDTVTLQVIRDRKPLALKAKLVNDPGPGPASMLRDQWPSWIRKWFDAVPTPPKAPSKSTTT
jgi:membrane-associated protease RseP (regulator of RpoE activity)